ncbi:hypothetical protein O7626_19435 [Micromonospora sp. WMMD1102]|uniref:hypothetical protein n=1 Tax=Micromonospora sp. WMMD1102 TaxID=3016105 RepID=UPI002414FE5C|nr:hypothetical protein [Micromonospora sp. WMMD1102]MDG4788087.1 hypothetical protein [Micromonospora sp. WMMD1102]
MDDPETDRLRRVLRRGRVVVRVLRTAGYQQRADRIDRLLQVVEHWTPVPLPPLFPPDDEPR